MDKAKPSKLRRSSRNHEGANPLDDDNHDDQMQLDPDPDPKSRKTRQSARVSAKNSKHHREESTSPKAKQDAVSKDSDSDSDPDQDPNQDSGAMLLDKRIDPASESDSPKSNRESSPNADSAASTTKSELRILLRAERIQKAKKKQRIKDLANENSALKSKDGQELKKWKDRCQKLEDQLKEEEAKVDRCYEEMVKVTRALEQAKKKMEEIQRTAKDHEEANKLAEEELRASYEKMRWERRIQEVGVFETLRERNPEGPEEETPSERFERKERQNQRIYNWLSIHPKNLISAPTHNKPTEPSEYQATVIDDCQEAEDFAYPELMCWSIPEARSLALKARLSTQTIQSFGWNNPRHFLRDANGEPLPKWEVDEIRTKVQQLLREHLVDDCQLRIQTFEEIRRFRKPELKFNKFSPQGIKEEIDCHLLSDLYWKKVRYDDKYYEFRDALDEYRVDLRWCENDWKAEELVKSALTKMRSEGNMMRRLLDEEYESQSHRLIKRRSKKRKSKWVKEESDSDEDYKYESESTTSSTRTWRYDSPDIHVDLHDFHFESRKDLIEVAKRLYLEISSVANVKVTRKLCREKLLLACGNTLEARKALYDHFGLALAKTQYNPSPLRFHQLSKRIEAKKKRRDAKRKETRRQRELHERKLREEEEEEENFTHPTSQSKSPQTGPSSSKVKIPSKLKLP